MRTNLLWIVLLGCWVGLRAQTGRAQTVKADQVPPAVRTAFANRFPLVKSVSWNREDLVYEAKFTEGGQRRDAEFDTEGTLIATERTILEKDLPPAVLKAFHQDYPEHDLVEIEEITDARTAAITYELDISRGKRRFEAIYDPNGKLIRQYSDD